VFDAVGDVIGAVGLTIPRARHVEANVAKVKRVRNDPRVRVGPCTVRGKPVGLPAEGRARILDQPCDVEQAEVALQANYGAGRRLYEGFGGVLGVDTVYLEITPA